MWVTGMSVIDALTMDRLGQLLAVHAMYVYTRLTFSYSCEQVWINSDFHEQLDNFEVYYYDPHSGYT